MIYTMHLSHQLSLHLKLFLKNRKKIYLNRNVWFMLIGLGNVKRSSLMARLERLGLMFGFMVVKMKMESGFEERIVQLMKTLILRFVLCWSHIEKLLLLKLRSKLLVFEKLEDFVILENYTHVRAVIGLVISDLVDVWGK